MKNSIPNQDFKKILFKTKSLHIRDLLFYYRNNIKNGISFIVNRKKGNAVCRNLFKRRCRSLVYSNQAEQFKNMQIIIKPVKNLKNNYTWKELKQSFEEFSCKLEL